MRMERVAITAPGNHEMLVRNHSLSLDPYMRGMMSERDSYVAPIPLVVAAAVGTDVGQFAKRMGLRVVGVAGGPEKCDIAVGRLGFDACIDYRAPDFDNVGGRVLRAVVPLLNQKARIALCGNVIQGFLVTDYLHLWADFHAEVMPWVAEGEIRYVEDISNGLDAAPQGLRDRRHRQSSGAVTVQMI